jgi:hypothetical protein
MTVDYHDDAPAEEALDLTALRSLSLDPARHAALADRIVAAAAPLLAQRAARVPTAWDLLAGAVKPVLVAAAAVLVLAIGLGRRAGTSITGAETDVVVAGVLTVSSIDSALAAGAADAEWLAEQTAPSDADLARAIGLEAENGTNR